MTQIRNNNAKRVQVSFSETQWHLINTLEGELGNTDAEVVRNIVLSWLSEKSFISTSAKRKLEDK